MMTPSPSRVLVAEDEFLVAEMIASALEDTRFQLIGTAYDGEQAVDLTQQLHPDVVLMDIKMPKLDGLAAATRIQDSCPTPIVVLTAHETRQLVESAASAGVSAYLTKPPDAAAIEHAITIALARHHDLMECQRLSNELETRQEELKQALDEVRVLRGVIPICAICKKVRDDEGFWQQVEVYLTQHTDARCSHGLCPRCLDQHYGDWVRQPST